MTSVPPLSGRVAIVTGASGGIGRVVATTYAHHGAAVVLAARRADALAQTERLIADAGGTAHSVVADLTDETACTTVVRAALDRFGRVDTLVNNAAAPGTDAPVVEADRANWHAVLATNLVAPMTLSREVLRLAMLPAGGGDIQFFSSAAARRVLPGKAHYAASKRALSALAETLALEVGPAGVRVNTVVIGAVSGDLVDGYVARTAASEGVDASVIRRRLSGGAALRRLVDPLEVAEVSVWLAGPAASAVTGQEIGVTAG
ncbi:SDR family oxidoreductase [Mycolicibacterium sp. 3033]|nr:SDR family oxidoreductase [Mycolicibacterium aurantiacum]